MAQIVTLTTHFYLIVSQAIRKINTFSLQEVGFLGAFSRQYFTLTKSVTLSHLLSSIIFSYDKGNLWSSEMYPRVVTVGTLSSNVSLADY